MSSVYLAGMGGVGDSLVMAKPSFASTQVKYVNSALAGTVIGGTDAKDPYPSIEAALATADSSVIVVAAGHIEPSPSAPIAVAGNVTIVGCGSVALGTAPKFNGGAAYPVFYSTGNSGSSLEIRNCIFQQATIARTNVALLEEGFLSFDGCLFELGDLDSTGIGVEIDAGPEVRRLRVRNCTFKNVSTKTTIGASGGPDYAIRVGATCDTELESVVFDGGLSGFRQNAADIGGTTLRALNITCLNGADIFIDSPVTGYAAIQRTTGSSSVYWDS